ncbi:MAG TPA: AAA family ATPase, partial [Polyangiaceae bacterium]
GQGRTVNFKNSVIVLTSNIGSHHIAAIEDKTGIPEEDKKELIRRAMMEEVRKSFRPEFVNRLDEMVVFHRLDRAELRKIVDIQLDQFATRLAKRELRIELTDGAKDFLAEVGWDPQYGARPLKRAIQKNLEDPLARKVLGGEFQPGTRIVVDRGPDGLTFKAHAQN